MRILGIRRAIPYILLCAPLLAVGHPRTEAQKPPSPASKRPTAPPARAAGGLSNADVIALVKAELPESIIITKIRTAPVEELDVSTEGLIALKNGGASSALIETVLARAGRPAESPTEMPAASASPRSGSGASNASANSTSQAGSTRPVSLISGGKQTVLEPVAGTQRSQYAFVMMLMFLDFPGETAAVSTSERRPILQIRSDMNPAGQYWLVKTEVRKKKGSRTLKFGSLSGTLAPDEDWTVPTTAAKTEEGLWTISAVEEVEPGEYGIFKVGQMGVFGSDLLFGFSVK